MQELNPNETPEASQLNVPAAPAVPPPPQAMEEAKTEEKPTGPLHGLPAFEWNERTKNITVWSIAAGIVLVYLNAIGVYFSAKFFTAAILKTATAADVAGKTAKAAAFSFDFVGPLINGILSGIITAAILYFLYQRIFDWAQAHSWGKYLNTFFKLVFYPYLAIAVILILLGSLLNIMGAFVVIIFSAAGHLVYAVILDRKIGHYFTLKAEPPSVPAAQPAG